MFALTRAVPLPAPLSQASSRRSEAVRAANGEARESGSKRANLFARRKERISLPLPLPEYTTDSRLSIAAFLNHPSGVEAILNSRALHTFQPLDSNTYRCTLHKVQLLKFEVAPVLDLRVTPTTEDCTVEMLSCKFEGSKILEQQNHLFSAFMKNYITWEANGSEPYFDVDVDLKVTLEIYTRPFSLLPISAVEKPGNLLMQGLINKLVPLLARQLLEDYSTWVEEQSQISNQMEKTKLFEARTKPKVPPL